MFHTNRKLIADVRLIPEAWLISEAYLKTFSRPIQLNSAAYQAAVFSLVAVAIRVASCNQIVVNIE
jgi:hypothetical protein